MRKGVLLVRQYIESNFPGTNVTVPTKDSSIPLIDLLVKKKRTIQLKVYASYASKNFIPEWDAEYSVKKQFRAAGLFTPERQKLDQSGADYWVLVIQRSDKDTDDCSKKVIYDYVMIPPKELSDILPKPPRDAAKYRIYVWVTKGGQAWLGRGLSEQQRKSISENTFPNKDRELTKYLNNWSPIQEL